MNYGQDKFFNGDKGLYTTLISDLLDKYTLDNDFRKDVQVDSFWNESLARLLELLNQKIDPNGIRNYESSGLLVELVDGTIDDSVLRAALTTKDSNDRYAAIRLMDVMDADAGANFCGEDDLYEQMRFYKNITIESVDSKGKVENSSVGRNVLFSSIAFKTLDKLFAGEQPTATDFSYLNRGVVSGIDINTGEKFHGNCALIGLTHNTISASPAINYRVVKKPWVIPWFNLDMESYSKVRGEDKKLSVLADPSDLGFTCMQRDGLADDMEFRIQAMQIYNILVEIALEKDRGETEFDKYRAYGKQIDYTSHNFEQIDMDNRQVLEVDDTVETVLGSSMAILIGDVIPPESTVDFSSIEDMYVSICYSPLEQTDGIYPIQLTNEEVEQYFSDIIYDMLEQSTTAPSPSDIIYKVQTTDREAKRLLAAVDVVDEDHVDDNAPVALGSCLHYCGKFGSIQLMEKEAAKVAERIGVTYEEFEDMEFDDFCTLWAQKANRWIRLIMPQNKRRVEVEDLNRNFWVIAQVIAGVSAYLFDGDGPIGEFLKGMIKEIGQLWENVIYLWMAQGLIGEPPLITDTHCEVLMPNAAHGKVSMTYDDFVCSPELNYLLQKYPDKNLCILPYMRKNNYENDYYSKVSFPGVYIYDRNMDNPSWEVLPLNTTGLEIDLEDYADHIYGIIKLPDYNISGGEYMVDDFTAEMFPEHYRNYLTFAPLSSAPYIGLDLKRYYGLARDIIDFDGKLYKKNSEGIWEKNPQVDIHIIFRDTVREMMTDRVLNLMEYKGQYEEGAITTKKYKTVLDSDPLAEVAPTLTPIKKGYYQGEMLSTYVDVDDPMYSIMVLPTMKTEPYYETEAHFKSHYNYTDLPDLVNSDKQILLAYAKASEDYSNNPEAFKMQNYNALKALYTTEEVMYKNTAAVYNKTTRSALVSDASGEEPVLVYPTFADYLAELVSVINKDRYISPYCLIFAEGEKNFNYRADTEEPHKMIKYLASKDGLVSQYYESTHPTDFTNANAVIYCGKEHIASDYPGHRTIKPTDAHSFLSGVLSVQRDGEKFRFGYGDYTCEEALQLTISTTGEGRTSTSIMAGQHEQWLTCKQTGQDFGPSTWLVVKVEAPYAVNTKLVNDSDNTMEKYCWGTLRDEIDLNRQFARNIAAQWSTREEADPSIDTWGDAVNAIREAFAAEEMDVYMNSWYLEQAIIGISNSPYYDEWYIEQCSLYDDDPQWDTKVRAWLQDKGITPQTYTSHGFDTWTGERIFINTSMRSEIRVYMFGPSGVYGQKVYSRNADGEFDQTHIETGGTHDVDTVRAGYEVINNSSRNRNYEKYKDFGHKTDTTYYDPDQTDDTVEGPAWYEQHVNWVDQNPPWDN